MLRVEQREQRVADKVTDEHVRASERGVCLAQLYPSIRTGYCLATINSVMVENMPFEDIVATIGQIPTPHSCEFRR